MNPVIFGTGFVPLCASAKMNAVPKVTGFITNSRDSGDFGCFYYPKISENFVRNINGTLRSRWKFRKKVVHLQRWSSLTGRSGPTETSRSIFKILVSGSTSLRGKTKFRSKRKWNASVQLEVVFLSNNVLPVSLG